MKKWHFKPWVQHTLEVITTVCALILFGINSIDVSKGALVWIGAIIAVIVVNSFLLGKYGRAE